MTRWVLIGSAALLVVLLLASLIIARTAMELRDAQRRADQVDAARSDAVSLLLSYVDQETAVRGYVITRKDTFLQPYVQAAPEIPRITASLERNVKALGMSASAVAEVQRTYGEWHSYAELQIARVDDGRSVEAVAAAMAGQGKQRFDLVRAAYRVLADSLQQEARAAGADKHQLEGRLLWLVALAVIALIVLLVAGAWVLVVAVAWPVARLAQGTQAVVGGHLAAPLPSGGAREIRGLAADVSAMRDKLIVDLDIARKALDASKQNSPAVAALREALLPGSAAADGISVVGRLDSAEGVLAGDWYDVLQLGSRKVAIVVGDVSGHGPASAVLALRLRYAVASALKAGASPGRALTVLGADLAQVPDDMFATVLVITVDLADGTLVYANAGHPSGLLLGRETAAAEGQEPAGAETGAAWTRISDTAALMWLDLPVTGPLLSPIVAGWAWGEREVEFGVGDTMLAFTDGLIEARDPAGEQFGVRRILDVVGETGVDDGQRLIDAICAAAVRHAAFRSRQDDQTIVYARREAVVVPQQAGPGRVDPAEVER